MRKIRQQSGKTIAQAAKEAGMTLSVYHKIEVGQREIYKNEIDPPGSVQRAKQISVEKKEQDKVDGNAKNTGELHGKA